MRLARSFTLLLGGMAGIGVASKSTPHQCPPGGPTLPVPKRPSEHPAVKAAVQGILATLEQQVANFSSSAVSIGIQSIHEDKPFLDFHHTPSVRDPRGTEKVDASTVYRIGSISKIFTVLAALKLADDGKLNMDDPIGKWIPELSVPSDPQDSQSPLDIIRWEDVTVHDVAAHLAGSGGDMPNDLAALDGKWEDLGLPAVSPEAKARICNGNGKPCTREDLMQAFKHRRPPVYGPGQQPVYSNAGLAMLGLVVESASGQTFEMFVHDSILQPLGMSNTTVGTHTDAADDMFIPKRSPDWNQDLGVSSPAGGINTNTIDLLTFMNGVLRSSIISPGTTRRWLKPDAFTSAWSSAVGAPWEIFRMDNLTSDGRIIDFYAKGGALTMYFAQMVLCPDFGLSISVFTAGADVAGIQAWPQLTTLKILEALAPAMDNAARGEAKSNLVGKYVDKETDSRLTISMDDGSGLVLSDWVARGVKVLPNLNRYAPAGASFTPSNLTSIRMYPTGLETQDQAAWRAVFPAFTDEAAKILDESTPLKDASCLTWSNTDKLIYNYLSLDHFEFQLTGDGQTAASIKSKAFDIDMVRQMDGQRHS